MNAAGRRVVIVGLGFMATVHARAARRAGGDIVAVIGRGGRSGPLPSDFAGATYWTDLSDALEATRGDVVHVCTPNALHHDQVLLALSHGVDVICEKPLAVSLEQASGMLAAADQAGASTAIPFIYRYYAPAVEMRQRITDGDLGTVQLAHGTYLQDWLGQPDQTNWRVSASSGGPSRTFADIGIHWCDLLEHVTGQRITRLAASTRTVVTDRPGSDARLTEDVAAIQFELDHGALGSALFSQISHGRSNALTLSVDGSAQALWFAQEDPEILWSARPGRVEAVRRGTPAMTLRTTARDRVPAGHPQGYQDAFDMFVADAYAATAGGQSASLPTFADGVRAARLTQAVLDSAAQGTWVVP